MTSRDFCYWLQGFFEINDCELAKSPTTYPAAPITAAQATCIRNHLNMVFKHEIDPSHGDAKQQQILNDLHQGGAAGVPPKPFKPSPEQIGGQTSSGILYRC